MLEEKQAKHIDAKIKEHSARKSELEDLGRDIAALARPSVVAFIDLADSTAIKENRAPEDWLGFIYEFIKRCSQLISDNSGVVVKRIGDEIMATFQDPGHSERFLNAAVADPTLAKYRYKIALDYGKVYHFQFIDGAPDDPYGSVVDRCARIAKKATPGIALCSSEYRTGADASDYFEVGRFHLKGFSDACRLYAKSLLAPAGAGYTRTLLANLNSGATEFNGFKTIGRRFSADDLREIGNSDAKPFLVRELLNLPRCPYGFRDYLRELEKSQNKEDFCKQFVGYVVEWQGKYSSHSRLEDYFLVFVKPTGTALFETAVLEVSANNTEVVKALKPGQEIKFRGIIESVSSQTIMINYVDFELAG